MNVGTEFEANFGDEGVTFTFKAVTNSASDGGQVYVHVYVLVYILFAIVQMFFFRSSC